MKEEGLQGFSDQSLICESFAECSAYVLTGVFRYMYIHRCSSIYMTWQADIGHAHSLCRSPPKHCNK